MTINKYKNNVYSLILKFSLLQLVGFGDFVNVMTWGIIPQGENLSADQPAANKFILDFNTFVKDGGLYYKLLPQRSLVGHFEKSADGRKTQKERVTISACFNALGTIKYSDL